MAARPSPPIPVEALEELRRKLPKGVSLKGWADCRPRYVSPSPGEGVEGAFFDVDAVVHVVKRLYEMPHTKGRWGGSPFVPSPGQIVWILAPVFGWKHPAAPGGNRELVRIVREVWYEVPRKAGKSTLIARIGLVLEAADGEWGAEVYSAAGSIDQAGFVFEPAKTVAERMKTAGTASFEVLSKLIKYQNTGSIFRVLSKAGDLAHGANVHGGIIDEIHVHKSRDLIDAITTGTGAREQPLIFYATTADDGDDTSIYGELHNRAIKLSGGTERNPASYAVIWAADREDDPFDEATWAKANPHYPETPSKAYLEMEAAKARSTPSLLPTFKRLHLNVRTAATSEEADWDWAEAGGLPLEDKLDGRPTWGGLVMASATELAYVHWLFRSPEDPEHWWALWRIFLPEERLGDLNDRTNNHASAWVDAGYIKLTEGDVVDGDAVLKQIRTDAGKFNVKELAFDPSGSMGVVQPLQTEARFTLVPIFGNTGGGALVDFEGLVRSRHYEHGANPVIAWNYANLRLRDTATGSVKIDRKGSLVKVDGLVAAEFALRRALLTIERPRDAEIAWI